MDIKIKIIEDIHVVEIIGDIDGKTAPALREQVDGLLEPEVKILLDMSGVEFMSSAGLRVLLATYRQVSSNQGQVALVSPSEEIRDTMSMTGFLRFFTVCDTLDDGVAALQ